MTIVPLPVRWVGGDYSADLAMEGEDAFWAALCRAIVNHPLWKRFDLGRLPHADIVVASAGRAVAAN